MCGGGGAYPLLVIAMRTYIMGIVPGFGAVSLRVRGLGRVLCMRAILHASLLRSMTVLAPRRPTVLAAYFCDVFALACWIRYDSSGVTRDTKLKFMTDGILLREIQEVNHHDAPTARAHVIMDF